MSMANAPTPGQRSMANALSLGHREVVNPPPYPGGTLGDPLDISIIIQTQLHGRSFVAS